MCGIAGFTHFRKRLTPGVLAHALQSISHRGPDHQGRWSTHHVSLGATRLRILDLSAGDQPLVSPDGRVVVVLNGEIFNHRELRAELERLGSTFLTHCDTEVVLQAYCHWGDECFSRFRGMFAVAAWDNQERKLLLARDQMGIKPLYYFRDGLELYFGSELKAIFANPAVPRNICLTGLNCYLGLNYVPGPYTLVDGVLKVMPGHLLEWRDGNTKIRSYVGRTSSTPKVKSVQEACDQLDHLLTKSIQEQLAADVPVGIWLSGGLDSTTILHYVRNLHSGPLRTFSITFNGRSFNELKYIREAARHYGTLHSDLDLGPENNIPDAIEQLTYYSDEPSADAGALPLWFLAKLTKNQATVILTGEGADELFAGYLTYKADAYARVARKLPHWFLGLSRRAAQSLPVSDDKISFEYKLKRFLEGSIQSYQRAHVWWNGTFSEEQKERMFYFADAGPLDSVLSTMAEGAGLQTFLDFDQRYYLPDDILYKVDRMSMAHSIEVRPPFLDVRIVDFAAQLPATLKLNGTTSKYVLRRLMTNKLPPAILRRPKIGFDIPVHDWLRHEIKSLLLDTINETSIRESGLFHWPAIEELLQAHLQRKANLGYHLWGLMVLLMWMRRWQIGGMSTRQPTLIPVDAFGATGSYS